MQTVMYVSILYVLDVIDSYALTSDSIVDGGCQNRQARPTVHDAPLEQLSNKEVLFVLNVRQPAVLHVECLQFSHQQPV